jgi:aryl-alcohol dehydrogenase-like predicted oxidoreductase
VEALRPLAAAAGMSLTRLAFRWVLAEPAITAPIVGASRADQLDDVLAAAEKPLDAVLKARLDEMTHEYRRGDDPRSGTPAGTVSTSTSRTWAATGCAR